MTQRKLFERAPADACIFYSVTEMGSIATTAASKLPLPVWPDRRWCFEVALYLEHVGQKNHSRFSLNRTLETYVYQLSPLIRFCWRENVSFDKIGDEQFTKFIGWLSELPKPGDSENKPANNDNSVAKIGRRSLDFLEFVSHLHNLPGFLSGNGVSIIAEKRAVVIGSGGSGRKPRVVYYWHHHSFPEPVGRERRHLIGIEYIRRLRRAAITSSSNSFVQQRRLVLLRLLECTGGRREEIGLITKGDIYDALAKPGPFLTLKSAKKRKRNRPTRKVKVNYNDLDFVKRYIEVYRDPHVEEKGLKDGGDGLLFVNFDTGRGMSWETISGELRIMRIDAEISGKAHSHLFRHRFITVRLMEFIQAHRAAGKSEFELMFKMQGYKKEIAESTGHSALESLDEYIDYAFIELAGSGGKEREFIDLAQIAASVQSSLAEIDALLRLGLAPEELCSELLHRYQAVAKDIGAANERRARSHGDQALHDAVE